MNKVFETLHQVINQFNTLEVVQKEGLYANPSPLLLAELETVIEKLPSRGTLIDIGTAAGIIPHTLHRLGYNVTTIDQPMDGKPSRGLDRAKKSGINTIMAIVGKDAINLPSNTADVIFVGDVIEHLPDSPRPFMAEIARLLKPRGWCILTTPNAVRLTVRVKVMFGYSNWVPLEEFYHQNRNYGHHKEYLAEELENLLKWSHFENISYHYVEDTLKRTGIVKSINDIKTRDRNVGQDRYRAKFDALNYMEYLRVIASGITTMFPRLRSSIICQSQNPSS